MRSAATLTGRLPLSQKPRMPLRARRWGARALVALAVLLLLATLAWTISWVSYLPQLNLSAVSITGTEDVSSQLVQAFVEMELTPGSHPYLSPDNVFLFNEGKLSREIVGFFPRIASVSISRPSLFSTALHISVVERQPFALWCTDATNSECYDMDEGGFVFAQAPAGATTTSLATPYVFYGGFATSSSATDPIGTSFSPAHLPGIFALLQMLSEAQLAPEGATLESDQDIEIPLQQGFYLKASFGEDANTLVNNLQLILSSDALSGKESDLEYVDLRFGDKVYYKLQGQDQTSASSSSTH